VKVLERQRVQKAETDAIAVADAAADVAKKLADATKEAEETATGAAAAAGQSAPEESQFSLSGSTAVGGRACCT
jgi:hypothetical protein